MGASPPLSASSFLKEAPFDTISDGYQAVPANWLVEEQAKACSFFFVGYQVPVSQLVR
jgi:hypothetical protein